MATPSLAQLRESRWLTQSKVAAAVGVQSPQVSYWECGRHKPKFEYREKYAQVLGVSPEELDAAINAACKAYSRKKLKK